MMKHLASFLLGFALLPAVLTAQQFWSLDQCISYALENNLELKQQSLETKLSEFQLTQSKLALLPNLRAGTDQTYRFGRSVDPLTYDFTTKNSKGTSFSATAGLVLFNGLQNLRNINKNELDLEKSLANYETAKNNLTLTITRYYLEILFNMEILEVAAQQTTVTDEQVARTERMVTAGALPKGELLEIRAQLAEEHLLEVKARNQLELSLLDLAQLLDLTDPDLFQIAKPDLAALPMEMPDQAPQEIYQQSLLFLPAIKRAELEMRSQEKGLQLARGKRSPTLSLLTSWGTGYSDQIHDVLTNTIMPFRDQFNFASTSSIRFSLSIPVFNQWATQTDIQTARVQLQNSHYQWEIAQSELRKEIQQAWADARTALERYRATVLSLQSLEEAFSYVEQRYNAGMLTSVDYKLSKNNLTRARSELLQARYHFLFNSKILDFYRGFPIRFN